MEILPMPIRSVSPRLKSSGTTSDTTIAPSPPTVPPGDRAEDESDADEAEALDEHATFQIHGAPHGVRRIST
jgi:hypothetical protein